MIEMLTHDFIREAVCACIFTGTACAIVGVYIAFKRIVFLGITLAQVSTMGVGLALLAGLDPVLSAMAFCLASLVMLAPMTLREKVPRDTVVGTTYVAASAATMLILAVSPLDQGQVINL